MMSSYLWRYIRVQIVQFGVKGRKSAQSAVEVLLPSASTADVELEAVVRPIEPRTPSMQYS